MNAHYINMFLAGICFFGMVQCRMEDKPELAIVNFIFMTLNLWLCFK